MRSLEMDPPSPACPDLVHVGSAQGTPKAPPPGVDLHREMQGGELWVCPLLRGPWQGLDMAHICAKLCCWQRGQGCLPRGRRHPTCGKQTREKPTEARPPRRRKRGGTEGCRRVLRLASLCPAGQDLPLGLHSAHGRPVCDKAAAVWGGVRRPGHCP